MTTSPTANSTSQPLLDLRGVHKRFPGVHALRGVDFSLHAGEIHALVGENGAGKSTLIKIMSGVHQPDEGRVLVSGQSVNFQSPKDAQTHGIDTIHQELSLYPELSVAENIFLGHAPMRQVGPAWSPVNVLDWETMRTRAQELLADLDASDIDVRAKVGSLNIGNRQRVEIAKALSLEASVLIMDEPTAALTEADVAKLFVLTKRLRERGVGIIYITHRLTEVFELADRVTVLRDGSYIDSKPTPETNEAEVISMMVGRTIEQLFPKQMGSPGEVVLEVRNLTSPPLTKNVSFSVRAGEIVGLAGLVGSGRSETAQVLFGITPATSGEVLLNGQSVNLTNPTEAIAAGIAYVPEDRAQQGLIRPMTIRENVSLAVLSGNNLNQFIDSSTETQLAADAITQFAIRATGGEQVVGKLSGGNQQKVVVSKWLASKPKLLIIDEPTRGVDVGAKAEIHRIISALAVEQGLAILMISSELPEILGMSDRVLVMREGELVAEFARHEFAHDGKNDAPLDGLKDNQKDNQAERLKQTQERIAAAMMRASSQSDVSGVAV
ncbi:MAG: sugar ABC transporter ATP-binding protein [Deinococcota bacterium]